MKVIVKIDPNTGAKYAFPVSGFAKYICKLAGQTYLTGEQVKQLQIIGYEINEIKQDGYK